MGQDRNCELTVEAPVIGNASPAPASPSGRSRSWVIFRSIASFPAVLIGMVMSLVFQLARRGLVDPDIWLHLRNAEFLFKTGSLPHFDMYSFTASGHPWVAHEWGGEVAFYL